MAKAVLQGGCGEGCVITFGETQEIQKIMEMEKIPKGRNQCTLVQLCTLLTRRKVPAFSGFLPAISTHSSHHLFLPFLSPLPQPCLSISPLFLFSSLLLVSSIPVVPSLPSVYLSYFVSSSHLISWKEGGDNTKYWSEGWQSWVAGIHRVAPPPWATSQ